MRRAEPLAVALTGTGLQHGMADEGRGQAVLGEPGRLERQQAQQPVPKPRVVPHAMGAPGPDLGRNVMHAGDAQLCCHLQHAMSKARAIDRHDHVRLAAGKVSLDLGQTPAQQPHPG